MTYETVAAFSQIFSLLLFIAMFIAAVAYAFWPGNASKFEEIQKESLDLDAKRKSIGGH